MATVTWLVSMPQTFEADGYTCEPADQPAEQEFDAGPPGFEPGEVAEGDIIKGHMLCTLEQQNEFKAWRKSSLAMGRLPFDWVHPDTGESCEMLLRAFNFERMGGLWRKLNLTLRTLS